MSIGTFRGDAIFDDGLGMDLNPEDVLSGITNTDDQAESRRRYEAFTESNPDPLTPVTTKKYYAKDGKAFDTEAAAAEWDAYLATTAANAAATRASRESAWSVLQNMFSQYGLVDLITPLKDLIMNGASEAEMMLQLRQTPAYKQRFAANEARVAAGLSALSEAEYLALEDKYTDIMRRYGLPEWYTATGANGRQQGLEQFIANDVSAAELEDRVILAVNRIKNGPQEVMDALRQFYPNITNGDVLAYMLDPKKALPVLQRQVQTAEIGGEALRYGLNADLGTAETLATLGIEQREARKGYEMIAGGLERGGELADLYGMDYDQSTAESEVFGMNDSTKASKKRRRIIGMEQATFGGSTGVRGGALDQNAAGAF